MRLSYGLELVGVAAVGLGLASWRMSWEELTMYFGPMQSPFDRFEFGADAFFAGAGLAGGAATIAEGLRRKAPWGPGRWAWAFLGMYVFLTQADKSLCRFTASYVPDASFPEPVWEGVLRGIQGHNGLLLFPEAAWATIALGLIALVARSPRDPVPDAREWCGRVFASLVIVAWLGLRMALWLRFHDNMMGGE